MAAKIEAYLLAAKGWVKASELCAVFGVKERALRALGEAPGLCTEFAISGDKGYRHITHATDAEFARFYARSREHGIRELIRIRKLRRRRLNQLARRQPAQTRDGQFLLISPDLP